MFRILNRRLMIGTVARLTPTFVIPIFTQRNENDVDVLNLPDSPNHKTGWERVRAMFSKNEYDEVSVELHNVAQATFTGLMIGACLGGFVKSREAYLYFIENNQATIFNSTAQAKKKLQDYVTIAFARGAYHWGWRLGIFTGLFSLIATTVSVYRDESSLADYVTAGTLTGAIYKANLGPAAMIVGAMLGGILSTIGGLLVFSILKVSGVTMADIRKELYKLRVARENQYKQAVDKAATEKNDDLTRHHDTIVEEKGVKTVDELT